MKRGELNNILDIPTESFLELCENHFPEKKLFIFEKGNVAADFLTGKMLAHKATILGNILQMKLASQEKALIIMPQGLEYIYSLLACFYANVVAVPIPVSDVLRADEVIDKVTSILKDSQAKCIITDAYSQEFLKGQAEFNSIEILNAHDLAPIDAADCQERSQLPGDTAILLYTSGSTSQPKGVMISHYNLKVRALVSANQWQMNHESCIVTWLPQYHSFAQDLNIFSPLLKGATSVIQAPGNFVKNPQDWLMAISRYKASHTGAPNFAFDYCCNSIDGNTLKGISLESLQFILSGGEPIHTQSCENFYNKFQSLGLKRNVFAPIYGLSEMGTVVTKTPGKSMQILSLDISSLQEGKVKISDSSDKAKSLTSCGEIGTEVEIQIVHPENHTPCSTEEVGEIWIKSPAIGQGYYNRRKETEDIFGASLKGNTKDKFLRTGDLGFIKNRQLYIVGREKEVIIIHGKNYHPVDIEWTIKNNLPYLILPTAVFSCEIDQEERVIVVQELENEQSESDYKRIAKEILSAVSHAYQLKIYDIVLVRKGGIPRTGSGKIRRKACCNDYVNQQLNLLYKYRRQNTGASMEAKEIPSPTDKSLLEILKKEVFVKVLHSDIDILEEAKSFNELGLNSIQYIQVAKRIEEFFNIEFNPVMLYEFKDFTALSNYIFKQSRDFQDAHYQSNTKENSDNYPSNNGDNEIAIIGISCHFPGDATDVDSFWNNLMQQKDCISPISDRPSIIKDYEKSRGNTEDSLPKWGGFIKDADAFDASFFHISTLEAESMDPQQRKVLELTWSVIEDGGYNPRQLSDKQIGLFIGVHTNDYAELVSRQPGLMETYGAFLDSGLHISMIANRVSRFLDFHGPSEVINTACSSSLVAVHHAVEAISKGECNLAVAGGVNLLLASRVYCATNKGGMLSDDGRCKTFDQSANGFVRAEGYGAILLKPVIQAKADGDTIYGVIKAAEINHDGQSNSLRAPNLAAQKQLIKTAYKKSNIPTWSVGYIETHGTGTALGDPIEIQALKDAFLELGDNKIGEYCALGSVKTNIGHCESAAGIAGLIKVLLAIRHKTIPAVLHFKQLNPYITLQNSPFYVADKHYKWDRLKNIDGSELPLRAGISSFGFGGSNAHVIIEEYISEKADDAKLPITSDEPVMIVLSARDNERLKDQAQHLLNWLSNEKHNEDLINIAYTLQTGREAMDERLGIVAESVQELKEKLLEFIDGKCEINNLYRGQVARGKNALVEFVVDEDIANAIESWVDKKKYGKLLDLWVKGFVFDWSKLYSNLNPRRISLPTYPFAKDRYWIIESNIQEASFEDKVTKLHPLLHINTSSFAEQSFSTVFSGDEFFLKDHKLKIGGHTERKVLPGVAYLEMARAAIEQSMPNYSESTIIELRNTVWIQPVIVTTNSRVKIALHPNVSDNGLSEEIEYEICTQEDEQRIVHCQGQAVFINKPAQASIDIELLKEEIGYDSLDVPRLYAAFNQMGIIYGPSHRGIISVYKRDNQALALLRIPSVVEASQNSYLLHPSLMDSALQASICLVDDLNKLGNNPPMPFALESIQIISECPAEVLAWIRFSPDSKPEDSVLKYDIDLCDLSGKVCVQMKGFSTRVAESGFGVDKKEVIQKGQEIKDGLQHLIPVWNPLLIGALTRNNLPESGKILLLGGTEDQLSWLQKSYPKALLIQLSSGSSIETIQAKLKESSFDHLLWIAPDVSPGSDQINEADINIIDKQEDGVLAVFRIIKALLKLGYAENELHWTIIIGKTQKVRNDDLIRPTHAGIFGLVGSLAKEYLHWNIRLLDVDSLQSLSSEECLSLPFDKEGNGLAHRNGEWFKQELAHVGTIPKVTSTYKQRGVYVVIGGAGGVGEVWSRYMIEQYQARIIWIGRQEYNSSIEDKIRSLSLLGDAPLYISADATKSEALEHALEMILKVHPKIHGVIHSAIVLQDQSITQMEESRFRASLSAKVDVSINMEKVFGSQDLDFMLFFSSLMSFNKSAGQSNYAAGCTFKDSYALHLQETHVYPVKIVNWGYWGIAGIVTDESYRKRMIQKGIGSIESDEGMEALQNLVGSEVSQMILHKTLNAQALEDLNVSESVSFYPTSTTLNLSKARVIIDKPSINPNALKSGMFTSEMEALISEILISSLVSLGLFKDGIYKMCELLSEKQPAPFYEKWLVSTIDHLQQQGLLNANLTVNKIKKLEEAWAEWESKKSAWIANPDLKAHITLLEACLKALPNILRGKQPATDVMFPNSSMELVEGIYKKNVVADYYNQVLAETLRAFIKQKYQADKGSKFRILEIGAGTGGTTARLLPMLKEFGDFVEEYCYTDLSKAFLLHAEEHYQPQFPALTTALFDISKPLSQQSQTIQADHYDLVIATNVLHATNNIRKTLRNAKAVLKNQGVILLNEISTWSLFTHLTFGLLDGWWLYEDAALRLPGSPALTPEKWLEVLYGEGFKLTFFPAADVHGFGQQIIAASSDGVVRQQINIQEPKPVIIHNKPALANITEVVKIKKDSGSHSESLRDKCIPYFQKLVAETLRMSAGQINPYQPLSEYGLDSILVVQLTNKLRKIFPDITSTLFFEVQTVDGLVDYFIENKKDILLEITASAINTIESLKLSKPAEEINVHEHKVVVETKSTQVLRRGRQNSFPMAQTAKFTPSIFDVAIVGVSGRYPQSKNLNEFWLNLSKGLNCITEIPKDRWNWEDYFDPEKGKPGKIYTKWGGFINDIDKFDPLFFKISPKEAKRMDPQERLFLEAAYHAIEDAGYTPEGLGDIEKIGVFAGVMNARYTAQPFHYSIANRVSYLLNFQGPSLAVDTACSASLTAIHMALESMYSGLTTCAIAGGVNLIIDPVHYTGLSEMTMLSTSNQCKAFGDQADGFVDSEGVGVVILKPLHQAEKDGDHIYGVIKGSAINAGGRTNGYTVPNPKAQAAVVSKALERSNMVAEEISYIEAHGTGTALGDPIEISSLTRSFKETTNKNQFCSIGSVKSNIGHGESAAGIAGLTKVLLQLKYQELVPSLHSNVPNPEIDFSQTPFKVQKSLEKWQRPLQNKNGIIKEIPRTAGISSFGAGGANAHLIVQEYISSKGTSHSNVSNEKNDKVFIPLSARTSEQLKQKAYDLAEYIRDSKKDLQLDSVAYTLQVGRVAMDERVGFMVSTADELLIKLQAYLNGEQDIEDIYRGQVKDNKDTLSLFSTDSDLRDAIDKWIAGGKYSKLFDLWVKGLNLDWSKFYGEIKPERISLPTYPFARERYWIDTADTPQQVAKAVASAVIHPLLQVNTSDLLQQSYSSTFNGKEFFFEDFKVNTAKNAVQKILSPAAYLEMARVAIEKAMPHGLESSILELHNIAWGEPFIAGDNKEVTIALFAKEMDQVDFEIYSLDNKEEIIHCQGQAIFLTKQVKDILTVKQRTNGSSIIIQLPLNFENNLSEYALHPTLMNSALKVASGFIGGSSKNLSQSSYLFALDSLSILANCSKEMVVWVGYSQESVEDDVMIKLDIDLFDQQGNICVTMRGLTYQRDLLSQLGNGQEQIMSSMALPTPKSIQLASKEISFNIQQEKLNKQVQLNELASSLLVTLNDLGSKEIEPSASSKASVTLSDIF
ncbi:MAG: polyketide synthase dehydratase domain-containing protein [Sporocytophaga sp.]|uniref:beta-ketoacyl synthase N-terminal-like domain-containing protein n=1 Tax=Sporocytophaga sp. TaxID=2231183 RepID=UPI001B079F39|nr:beta-ketoacyl synthase N-terminal-like domain-containing protein [Sporocytophaga sp.]MBO9699914.1 polyketide synthase dehydratase domain-containing protein [Sporocytophaga sp.]